MRSLQNPIFGKVLQSLAMLLKIYNVEQSLIRSIKKSTQFNQNNHFNNLSNIMEVEAVIFSRFEQNSEKLKD